MYYVVDETHFFRLTAAANEPPPLACNLDKCRARGGVIKKAPRRTVSGHIFKGSFGRHTVLLRVWPYYSSKCSPILSIFAKFKSN